MTAEGDLSQLTIEGFRLRTAGEHPMPAGVAVAAVSAAFALGLLAKVLAVSARGAMAAAETAGPESLAAARAASQRMLQLAGDDVAAFEAYLSARRLPHAGESERQARQQAIEAAVLRAIEPPLAAAQEAAAGLQLCSQAAACIIPALIADLGVIASLLASALRGFLLCAQSNVRHLAPDDASLRQRVVMESQRHAPAFALAEAMLERTRTALAGDGRAVREP